MPYESISDLPEATDKLSDRKKRQWLAVFNSSKKDGDEESISFAKAWSTVNKTASIDDLLKEADQLLKR